jgi:hypothetical protein
MLSQASVSNDSYQSSISLLLEILFLNNNEESSRRQFLTTITQMIDKSNEINPSIMNSILDKIFALILGDKKYFLINQKEKIFFILKLSSFEHVIIHF